MLTQLTLMIPICLLFIVVNSEIPSADQTHSLLASRSGTLMGEYHLRGPGGLCMPLLRTRVGGDTYSCSGIFTLAFLAFSSFAPSSVEPFSPQRT